MDLNAALVFVRVIQAGGFSKAARQMNIPLSTVSARVAALEKSLGISLIQRSTRKLHLTAPGEIFFQHAVRAVNELQLAETQTKETQSQPQGRIRLTTPVELGMTTLVEVLSGFLRRYPKIHVDLLLTDRVVDLIGEGVDLAIRMGELKDSSLVVKRLGQGGFEAFASPKYLKEAPPLRRPQDLEKHACLNFSNLFDREWSLRKGENTQSVKITGPISANNLLSLHRLCVEGHGVCLLPPFLAQADIEKKRLQPVLEGWSTGTSPVNLVYPQQSYLGKSTRALIDHLSENLREFV